MDPINPTPPSQPEHLPLSKENRMAVIFFGCFVLLAIGLVAFFYYQNQQLKSMLAKYTTPTPSPSLTPTNDPLAGWKTYLSLDNVYQFRFPQEWNQITPESVDVNKVIYQSTDGLYRLTVESQPNKNKVTSKPYDSLDQFIGLPYTVKSLTVDNLDARQPLPRAGSEDLDKVYFFSPDTNLIYSIELLIGDGSGNDHRITVDSLQIGSDIFDKIVSSFKFVGPTQ